VKASVTVAYDQSSGDTTQEIYDPNNSVLVTDQVQEERFGGSVPAGIPGTTSNVPAGTATNAATPAGAASANGANAKAPAAPGGTAPAGAAGNPPANAAQARAVNPIVSISSDNEGQHSESRTFAVSKTLRHVNDPAGRVEKIAAAVLVDDAVDVKEDKGQRTETRRKRTPEEMKQIEELAKAAIGFDSARGDNLSVENVSFLSSPFEKPAPPTVVERVRVVAEKWIWLLRYALLAAVFGVIYAFVLRPVKNEILKTFAVPRAIPALAGAESANLSPQEAAALSESQLIEDLGATSSNVQRVVKLKKHLADKVKREPAQASILIRQWMNENREAE
jgi:flagellar M-ring protein FliF